MSVQKVSLASFLSIVLIAVLHIRSGMLTCEEIRTLFGLFGNIVECKIPDYAQKVDVAPIMSLSVRDFVQEYDANRIPLTTGTHPVAKVVHQIYKDTHIPAHNVPYVQSIRKAMPSWHHVLWTDEDVVKYLLERDGISEEDRRLFHSYPHAINRADMTRYLLMEQFGGLYLDTDAELLQDVERELVEHGGVWTVKGFSNSETSRSDSPKVESHMWVSRAGHPFWAVVRRFLHERAPHSFAYDVLTVTGPRLVYDALVAYRAENEDLYSGTFELFDSARYNFGRTVPDGIAHHHFVHEWLWVIKRVNIQRVLEFVGMLILLCAMCIIAAILCVPRRWPLYIAKASRYLRSALPLPKQV